MTRRNSNDLSVAQDSGRTHSIARIGGLLAALSTLVLPGLLTANELTRSEFIATFPQHLVEGFDDLQVGDLAPLTASSGFLLTAGATPDALDPEVVDEVVPGLGNDFWFGGFGSPPNYVVANNEGFRITFDEDVIAIGFEASSLATSPESILFSFYGAQGNLQQTQTIEIDSFSSFGHFISFVPNAPFAEVVFDRSELTNWMIDNVRFVPSTIFRDGFDD